MKQTTLNDYNSDNNLTDERLDQGTTMKRQGGLVPEGGERKGPTTRNSDKSDDPRSSALPVDSDDDEMTDSRPEDEKKRPRTTLWASTDDTAGGQVWTWNNHPGPTEKGKSIKLLPVHHPLQAPELAENEAKWKLWITEGETPEDMARSVAKNLQEKWSRRATKTAEKNGLIRLNVTPVEALGAPNQKLNCLKLVLKKFKQ